MGFPIKTSDADWLSKTIKLSNQRINISITDDAGYNLDVDSDSMKLLKRFTLSQFSLMILGAFCLLAVVSLVMLYYSLSLQFAKNIGITLSIISFFVCSGIPTYFLAKNKAPMVFKTENGIDIKFSNTLE
jgi:hypothetical protein